MNIYRVNYDHGSNSKGFIIVLRSNFIHQIHLSKTKLQSKEIKSCIVNEHAAYTIGTTFLEDYKLVVNIADFDKACTILSL